MKKLPQRCVKGVEHSPKEVLCSTKSVSNFENVTTQYVKSLKTHIVTPSADINCFVTYCTVLLEIRISSQSNENITFIYLNAVACMFCSHTSK